MAKYIIKAELLSDQTTIIIEDSEKEGLSEEEIETLANNKAVEWIHNQIHYTIEEA
ncbi:hypothetical protein [Calidifontibacillus erzurumensis]|uniref:hypothetical protein n=1 Tax=Calidifontibacillus erzurumensis TaxID=2741433 RepID=UPI0035B56B87